MRTLRLIGALTLVLTSCSATAPRAAAPSGSTGPAAGDASHAPRHAAQGRAGAQGDGGHAASVHLRFGAPVDGDPSDDVVLDETHFVLSYNPGLRVANWVSWRLTREDLGAHDRTDRFHADPLLPTGLQPVKEGDYAGAPFHRGHLCPSSHRTASRAANVATFVMTNMQPQVGTVNSNAWRMVEDYERRLAAEGGKTLHIVAGGIFDVEPRRIGTGVAVPKASYRITVVLDRAADKVTKGTLAYAVAMPNSDEVRGHKWTEYVTSIDEVERRTGYDYLSKLPDDVERGLEAGVPVIP